MRIIGAILVVTGLLGAACTASPAGGAAAASGTAAGRTIEIEMKEFAFSPATLTVRAGERVVLRARNTGAAEHDLMAGRNPKPSQGYGEDLFAGAGAKLTGGRAGHADGHRGVGLLLPAAQAGAVAFVVPSLPGAYEFGCFVAGHYEAGMKGTLIIE